MIRFHLVDEVIVTVRIEYKVVECRDGKPVEGENCTHAPIQPLVVLVL